MASQPLAAGILAPRSGRPCRRTSESRAGRARGHPSGTPVIEGGNDVGGTHLGNSGEATRLNGPLFRHWVDLLRAGRVDHRQGHAFLRSQRDRGGPEHLAGDHHRLCDYRHLDHHRGRYCGNSMNRTLVLFLNVLIISTCGLIYELLAGTLASYVLGDSVTHFSLIIGIYLFALGAGAWLSRFIDTNLARYFIEVELAVAVLGGVSAPLLFLSFANLS